MIILYLGRNVKEYKESAPSKIAQYIKEGRIRCDICTQPIGHHSSYTRGIKETIQKITIAVVYCKKCKRGHALLPDFLLPYKQYSGDEIESVIIDSTTLPINQIDTEASESTVRRWIVQVVNKIKMAISKLKYQFIQTYQPISEIRLELGSAYNELEQILYMHPTPIKYSGNKLGLANILLSIHSRKEFI